MARLIDLDASFVGAGGEGVSNADGSPVPERSGVGLSFNCPCPQCAEIRRNTEPETWRSSTRVFVQFRNPIDGGPQLEMSWPAWNRIGNTLEAITIEPSIQRMDPDGCKWHGYVRNGSAD